MFKLSNIFKNTRRDLNEVSPVEDHPTGEDIPLVELADAFPDFDGEGAKADSSEACLFEASTEDGECIDTDVIEIRIKTDVEGFDDALPGIGKIVDEPDAEVIAQQSYIQSDYTNSERFSCQTRYMTAKRFIVSVDHGLYHNNVRDESSIRGNLFLPDDVLFDEVFEKDADFELTNEAVTPEIPKEKLRFEFV